MIRTSNDKKRWRISMSTELKPLRQLQCFLEIVVSAGLVESPAYSNSSFILVTPTNPSILNLVDNFFRCCFCPSSNKNYLPLLVIFHWILFFIKFVINYNYVSTRVSFFLSFFFTLPPQIECKFWSLDTKSVLIKIAPNEYWLNELNKN